MVGIRVMTCPGSPDEPGASVMTGGGELVGEFAGGCPLPFVGLGFVFVFWGGEMTTVVEEPGGGGGGCCELPLLDCELDGLPV